MSARARQIEEPGVAARVAAARAVHAVIVGGRSLDNSLDGSVARLDGDDRAFARQLAFGTVRWYRRLAAMIEHMTGRPLARLDALAAAVIAIGLYQLWRLRVPDHAAVDTTVNAIGAIGRGRLRGLTNALLRRFLRERDSVLEATSSPPALAAAHPDWLAEAIATDWGDRASSILAANNARPPMWLRVNRMRSTIADYRQRLAADPDLPGGEPSALAADALRLERPVAVERLPGFDDGVVSVQDAAAQLAVDFLCVEPGMRVLDACAAPGGKSAHALERTGGAIDLTAIDSDATRLERVAATLDRIGLVATLCVADATDTAGWWDGRGYDRILIDAPCSATGVIRRHPDIRHLRRAGDIAPLARRQLDLLRSLWPLLAPGGRLVYATCSILKRENADVVNEFLSEYSNARALDELPTDNNQAVMVPQQPGVQILPGGADLDGFYYACFERRPDMP